MTLKAYDMDPDDPDVRKEWIATLTRHQRIENLQQYLASTNNDDSATRTRIQQQIDYLKAREQASGQNCHLVGNVTSTETPLVPLLRDAIHLRGLGLSVIVNGTKFSLMLDTGASGILVDEKIAEKAGVTRLSDTRVWGIGDQGSNRGWMGLAKSIKIGELEFQNCPVEVIEKRSVADENGLIGADVFEDFLVDLNYPDRRMRLSELPKRPGQAAKAATLQSDGKSEEASESAGSPSKVAENAQDQGPFDRYVSPEMQSFTRIFRFGHMLLVPTSIGEIPPKLFLLDTGAFNNTITPAAAREVTKVRDNSYVKVKGVNGQVKNVYAADTAVLRFGRLQQRNEDMVAFDMTAVSDHTGTEISGTLGFAMLYLLDIKIDYRDGLVDFTCDEKRFH